VEKENPENISETEEDALAEIVAALNEVIDSQDALLHLFRTGLLCIVATCAGLILAALVIMVLP